MTTYFTAEYTCAVCGRTHKFRVVGSTNSFGSPDLDLRPAPMQRDTIHTWVQTCPDCGYSNGKIDRDTSVDKKWLSRESYRNCEGTAFISGLAKKFYQAYMVNLHDGKTERAADHLVYCAWACDDAHDIQNAVKVRGMAADLYEEVLKTDDSEATKLMRMDLLRRSGRFEQLQSEYATVTFSEELHDKIAAFQKERAKAHDTACYCVGDVLAQTE